MAVADASASWSDSACCLAENAIIKAIILTTAAVIAMERELPGAVTETALIVHPTTVTDMVDGITGTAISTGVSEVVTAGLRGNVMEIKIVRHMRGV